MHAEPEYPRAESLGVQSTLVRIRSALRNLPAAEDRIARLIIADPLAAAGLSIQELAAAASTSTTSVIRFVRRMGFKHFKELRIELAREATRDAIAVSEFGESPGEIERDDSLAEVVQKVAANEILSISDTARSLDGVALAHAIELIDAARRIDSFGMGASGFVGLDLQQKLTRIGRTALTWREPHAAWTAAATLDSRCVAFGVSHSGDTAEVVRFLRVARANGARTVALTNHQDSDLVRVADVALTTATRETRFRAGALGSRIAQLMVIDCLFTGLALASFERSVESLEKTFDAIYRS